MLFYLLCYNYIYLSKKISSAMLYNNMKIKHDKTKLCHLLPILNPTISSISNLPLPFNSSSLPICSLNNNHLIQSFLTLLISSTHYLLVFFALSICKYLCLGDCGIFMWAGLLRELDIEVEICIVMGIEKRGFKLSGFWTAIILFIVFANLC